MCIITKMKTVAGTDITMEPEASIWLLKKVAKDLEPIDNKACSLLLNVPRFIQWPASESKHHVWPGGLAEHTAQVYGIAMRICDAAEAAGKPMNRHVVACASIFHDAGKIYDYVKLEEGGNIRWVKDRHYHLIHHVVRSAEMWDQYSGFMFVDTDFGMAVKHAILAHHGRLEWGSPIVPKTREAWAVHLADMSSVHCIEERKA